MSLVDQIKINYFGAILTTACMLENLTDKALLVSTDDHAAFRILYHRYWEPLYKKAIHRLGNGVDAQDAVQEVFISLWRNRDTIQLEDTLAPYLFSALKYSIIKQVYRKAKKGIQLPLSADELERTEVTTDELLQYKELQALLASEIAGLPDRMQEIYRLSRVENLPITEIARRLNISEQTVKNTLTTALKRLREKITHYSTACIFFF